MSDAHHPIPSPQPGDSDDVELALETAQRMYKNGDLAEALKWLRRAANSAEEAGDDMRQLQLARIAADLAAVVDSGGPAVMTSAPSIKPSAPPTPSPPIASRLPQPPAKQPPQAPSARSSVAAGPAAANAGGPPPLPSNAPKSPVPTAITTPGLESQTPPPARASESQVPPAPKPVTISLKPTSTDSAPAGTVVAVKPSAAPVPSVAPIRPDKPSSSTPSGFIDVGARGAVRVSVRVSARDENLMIVRPLAQGQRLPPGAREARLVFDDAASVGLSLSHGE